MSELRGCSAETEASTELGPFSLAPVVFSGGWETLVWHSNIHSRYWNEGLIRNKSVVLWCLCGQISTKPEKEEKLVAWNSFAAVTPLGLGLSGAVLAAGGLLDVCLFRNELGVVMGSTCCFFNRTFTTNKWHNRWIATSSYIAPC